MVIPSGSITTQIKKRYIYSFIYSFHDNSNAPIHDVHHIGARSASTHDIIIVQQSSISSQSE